MIPCTACGKQLYPLERMTLNSRVFHKQGCARCVTCSTNLSINNFAMCGDKLYCKVHYLSAFSKSGGRYSFGSETDDQDERPNNKRSSYAAPASEPRPRSEVAKPSLTTTPVKMNKPSESRQVPASAPAKGNKLADFISNAEGSNSSPSKNAELPVAPAPSIKFSTPVKATPTRETPSSGFSNSKAELNAAPPSTNKLAAFLAQAGSGDVTPLPKVQRVERLVRNENKEEQAAGASRPVSLKERIAIYSMEAANATKRETEEKQSKDLPPLPRKENFQGTNSTVASRKGSIVSQSSSGTQISRESRRSDLQSRTDSTRRSVSSNQDPKRNDVRTELRTPQTVRRQESTPQSTPRQPIKSAPLQTPSTESKLAAFLKVAEGDHGQSNQNSAIHRKQTDPGQAEPGSSIKERVEKYAAEAPNAEFKVPPLPPSKPSPAVARAMSPRSAQSNLKDDSGTIKRKYAESVSSGPRASDRSPLLKQSHGDGAHRVVSLKERIASYQAKASGLGSGKLRSPTRKSGANEKSPAGRATTTPPSAKRTGFRTRFPFLKNPVYASPSSKSAEFAKSLRKICDDGQVLVTKASVKHFTDAVPEVKAIAVDLLESYARFLKRLDEFEASKKPTTIA